MLEEPALFSGRTNLEDLFLEENTEKLAEGDEDFIIEGSAGCGDSDPLDFGLECTVNSFVIDIRMGLIGVKDSSELRDSNITARDGVDSGSKWRSVSSAGGPCRRAFLAPIIGDSGASSVRDKLVCGETGAVPVLSGSKEALSFSFEEVSEDSKSPNKDSVD